MSVWGKLGPKVYLEYSIEGRKQHGKAKKTEFMFLIVKALHPGKRESSSLAFCYLKMHF